MLNISHLPFTQQMQVHEANVRGVYVSIACDYERLMDDLIVLCEFDKAVNVKAYKTRYITHLEMGKKLRRSNDGLKKYNSIYYDQFSHHFDIIARLVRYRNILAHGYSDYDSAQKDKSFIVFEYFDKGKIKTEKIEVLPFLQNLEQYRNSIMELAGLVLTLRKEKGVL